MKIDNYSKQAIASLTDGHAYGTITPKLMAQVLGLVGESGEIAEKFKKILRDKQGKISETDRQETLKELGDVLWYVNSTAHLLDSSLEEVAKMNNEKLASRQSRGEVHGSGDNR